MLGIIIGVAAVITMVAVGAGAQARVEEQIKSLGSNLIIILSGNFTSGGVRAGLGLAAHDHRGRRLRAAARGPRRRRPPRRSCAARGQVVFGNSNWSTQIYGITPEYLEARQWEVAAGRAIDPSHVEGAAKVVAARADGGADALRRQRSAWARPCASAASRTRDRHARPQGPEHDRPGPGRRRADPDLDGEQARAGRHAGEEPQRRQHLGPRQATAPTWRRPSRRCATSCASATSCSRARRTTSSCATSPRCSPRRRHRRRSSRCCWPRSPRCRCWSAASAS